MLIRIGQKYLGRSEMWCRISVEKTSWTDLVKNEEVLHRIKEEGDIMHTIERGKANLIGHLLRWN